MTGTELATRAKELVAQVRSDQFVEQVALALPETVSPRRFARIAVTAIQQNPDLAQCDRDSVSQALLKCAADGLLPDGREAAIVKRGDKASYMAMIGGLRKLAAEYGWDLRSRAVRANDEFDWTEEPPSLTHRIARGDRGALVYAYAIATRPDGTRRQRVLDASQIAERRRKATTQKVWEEFTEQMWEKSAARDLFGELPLSEVDRARLGRMVESEQAYERAASDPVGALYGNGSPVTPRAGDDGAAEPAVPADPEGSGTGGADADRGGGSATDGEGRSSEAAAAAPSPEDGIEDAVWEPVDDGPSAEEVAQAGELKVGRGVHQGKTVAEVAEADEGQTWLLVQLKKEGHPPELATFVRGRLPELWARYQRWLETREQQQ